MMHGTWEAEYRSGEGPDATSRTLMIEAANEQTAQTVAEDNTGLHEVMVRFGPLQDTSEPEPNPK